MRWTMYSSVPTSSHSLSKKWKQLIKFYLDLFSMDESKDPDLCNIRVDRLGTTIIFLYSFFWCLNSSGTGCSIWTYAPTHTIIFLYSSKGCTVPLGCYMKWNRDDGTVVKSCFLWSKSAQVSLNDVWFVQHFTHHFHSCYFFLQLEFLILSLNTSVLFHYIWECVSYIFPERLRRRLVLQLAQSNYLPRLPTHPSKP